MRFTTIFSILIVSIFAKDLIIDIEGMHCPLCTMAVKKSLKKVDGVVKAKAILSDRVAYVTIEPDLNKTLLIEAIAKVGYRGVIRDEWGL